jgi:hypothetical protein
VVGPLRLIDEDEDGTNDNQTMNQGAVEALGILNALRNRDRERLVGECPGLEYVVAPVDGIALEEAPAEQARLRSSQEP